ncbi:MAG: Na+/H+ antiporter subunit E [Chloroflexota bacterium]
MNIRQLLFPLPFAILWIILTNQVGVVSFLIGYALAFAIGLLLVDLTDGEQAVRLTNLPSRVLWVVIYVVTLSRDIFLSGVDVSLRVIGLRPISRTGIVAVPVQADKDHEVIAGLSGHAITITPGELVVAYDDDERIMYVHCLDVEMSVPNLEKNQGARVKVYRRILGHD